MPTQLHTSQRRTVSYTRSGGVTIAYEVIGDGPLDVVLVPGFASHLDAAREEPGLVAFHRLLAEQSRLILYDRRGQGLSDRTAAAPTVDQHVADLGAVLDAVGSRRTALFAVSQGGPTAIAFAAAEPARTAALVLYGTYARTSAGDDYLIGPSPMRGLLERRVRRSGVPARIVDAPAEALPLPDDSFDTVVSTMVLCTVPDPTVALAEVRRVLRPDGQLLFCEHVLADSRVLARWQRRLARPWAAFAQGCRCDRPLLAMVTAALTVRHVQVEAWHGMPQVVRPLVVGRAHR
jgi:pimeloyl-ACP methyl ester carboxylesterase